MCEVEGKVGDFTTEKFWGKTKALVKRLVQKVDTCIQRERFGISERRVPLSFAIIPQYHISSLLGWVYGQDIIRRKKNSRILEWLHDGRDLGSPVFDFAEVRDAKWLANTSVRVKTDVHRYLYECITAEFGVEKEIRVLDIGCGDGLGLYALAYNLPDHKFRFTGVEPAAVRVNNAQRLFSRMSPANVREYRFLAGTFEDNSASLRQGPYDVVLCDQVITLMTIGEFEKMFREISVMEFTYLLISARMNYYYGIVGGTMPVYEKIMRNYGNFRLRKQYYWYRRPPSILNIAVHPIRSIKTKNYFHYKYLILEKTN